MPNGTFYGFCPAPTLPQLKSPRSIDCGNNITQNLNKNTTILQLDTSKKWLGLWTCKHGTKVSNDTFNITSSTLRQDVQEGKAKGIYIAFMSFANLVHVAEIKILC